ncbi:hypothetical protein [Fontivita pretiosa]|uniref:hypothetical protein n=1 Tax=Fontivita pretiosa TaxID=2989684 RepID=UPI003D173456
MRNRKTDGFAAMIVAATMLAALVPATAQKTRTETFDNDPGWEGVNNRSARKLEPVTVKQDFGYSRTNNAGGKAPGEIGGYIEQAGEAAFYGKRIEAKTLNEPLSASGVFAAADGAFHVQLGFFNARTTNEWRTPNTLGLRIQGRGDHLYVFADYCTSKWRAGGQLFTDDIENRTSSRAKPIEFASGGKTHKWSIKYDPEANGGRGAIIATFDDKTAVCDLDSGHKEDGARFTHFGIMNVMKSYDRGTQFWVDDLTINGQTETFDEDPKWEGHRNRATWQSRIVRPWFDFGYSPTHFAGGKNQGEMGGQIFRGDCRYPERMACYGDRIGPLTLDKPFKASGKIAFRRGVTDSTTCFGFYNSTASMRSNPSQDNAIGECVVGIHIEGPSSEGFCFYPVYRGKGAVSGSGNPRQFPHIYPDGASHDWSLEYDPDGAGGNGQITVRLDGQSRTIDLVAGFKTSGATFDRFGIITTWIDGNSQDVYWDDLTYTVSQ